MRRRRPTRFAPRKKVFDVEDPNAGGPPPGGASGEVLPGGGGTAFHAANAEQRSEVRQEGRGAPDSRPHGKKRRKRRRGRKVFARDANGLPVAASDPGRADHGKTSPA